MADFKPNTPYNVPFFLLTPEYKTIKGVEKKTFRKIEKPFYCSFRTFGGTQKVVNDVIVLEDTATVETWYDPRIKADCNIEVDGQRYEILGTPENVNMRNQYLIIKVRAIKGGA
jgi:hypothetical protein